MSAHQHSINYGELIIDLFAGGGGASTGIEMSTGRSPDIAINHDAEALALHCANHPDTLHYQEDVFERCPTVVTGGSPVGLLWFSPTCFPAGTLVMTSKGYQPVESIVVGDMLLTHKGRYRAVTDTMQANRPVVTVSGRGHDGLTVSPEHPFYAREQNNVWDNKKRGYSRRLEAARWVNAADLKTGPCPMNAVGGDRHYWATPHEFPWLPFPEVGGRGLQFSKGLMWLAGRYLGDGFSTNTSTTSELHIVCGDHEAEGLGQTLSEIEGLTWYRSSPGTCSRFNTGHRGLVEWMRENFGAGAGNKAIPSWALGMTRVMRQALLDGYLSADGHVCAKGVRQCTTISKSLAYSCRALVESLGMDACVYGPSLRPETSVIEGRKVTIQPIYRVHWRLCPERPQCVRDDLHNWSRVKRVSDSGEQQTVYNISVAEDESYVAEGVVVHNCTHFSKAKGSKLLNTKIRSLAWVGVRWARVAKPAVMVMENVEEFEQWGPLVDGKPDPDKKGSIFNHFVRQLRRYGYTVDWRQLKAHEYGAPTTRKRLFLVARRDGCKVQWPEASHGEGRAPFRTAAECIDWSLPCPSIFTRKKPLADATLARVARGLKRFVVDNPKPYVVESTNAAWILRQFGTSTGHKADEPAHTIMPDGGGKSVLVTAFLAKHYGGVTGHGVERPIGTVTTVDHHSLVTGIITPIDNRSSTGLSSNAVDEPLRTIVTENRFAVVNAFLVKYYGTNFALPVDEALRTITTRDRFALVTVAGVDYRIADIGMRMLQPRELYTAQGFPEDYVIDVPINGKRMTKKAQVRMVGNSVSPPPAAALISANYQHQAEVQAA